MSDPTPNTRTPADTGFYSPLHTYTPLDLVTMRNAIDAELRGRREAVRADMAAIERALGVEQTTKPKRRRSGKKPEVTP